VDSGVCDSGRKERLPHEVIAVFNDDLLQLSNYTRENCQYTFDNVRKPSQLPSCPYLQPLSIGFIITV
jgi:hypothetical protein